MKQFLFNLMAQVSGQAYSPAWEEKIVSLLTAGLSVAVFAFLFAFLYYKYTKSDFEARRLGIVSAIVLGCYVLGKFILYRVRVGYIPDRLLFYALPSPKVQNILWLLAAAVCFLFFMRLRHNFSRAKPAVFLFFLLTVFFLFTTTVAGIREGSKSIADSMSRTKWEYSGNVAMVENTHDFLRDYVSFIPKLAIHSTTHPPAYSLLLYYFHKLFNVSFLGMSLLVILTGGLSIFPIYFALKEFTDEKSARDAMQIFIFIPSIVLMSGTSMEAFFLTIVWSALALVLIGWRKSIVLSAVGGFALGIALLSNFLFLLAAPIFLAILWYVWRMSERVEHPLVILRTSVSFLVFVVFFVILWKWSSYSIVENFQAARGANQEAVISNFATVGIYFTFVIMNILSFSLALGIANVSLMLRKWYEIWQKNKPELCIGFVYVAFLLVIGVFQGEIERLWMFVVPLFLPAIARVTQKISHRHFSSLLSLLFFQIIIIQILFYTYW